MKYALHPTTGTFRVIFDDPSTEQAWAREQLRLRDIVLRAVPDAFAEAGVEPSEESVFAMYTASMLQCLHAAKQLGLSGDVVVAMFGAAVRGAKLDEVAGEKK
jgi:hypothetical protein